MNTDFILILLAPVFIVCMFAELWINNRKQLNLYQFNDSFANISLALLYQLADNLFNLLLIYFIYAWLYQWRVFTIETTMTSFIILFILQDFFYYWFHRASHYIRWMWASHVTHHSSTLLNFSTAFRQSMTYPISGMWIFWIPLVVIGYDPKIVVFIVAINLAFQFFVHTELINRLGILEKVFNTPSHHRVHHACNPEYIDKNFAGVFIIWDKLFDSFVEEKDGLPCKYGITKPVNGYNPLLLTFHEWLDMFKDFIQPGALQARLKHLYYRPEWSRSKDS